MYLTKSLLFYPAWYEKRTTFGWSWKKWVIETEIEKEFLKVEIAFEYTWKKVNHYEQKPFK